MADQATAYRWVLTCGSCPEQYDVYHGTEYAAYVRMRFGRLTASATADAEPFLVHDFDDPLRGWLTNDERHEFQARIEAILRAREENATDGR